jgi:uncharacterized protein (DUF342 family)
VNDASPSDVLTFKLNDDGKLIAAFEACESKPPLDEATIKEALAKQGFSTLFIYENSISTLLKQYGSSKESYELEIGERRDGSCTIKIDDDKMAARLTLIPPYGGAPVALFQIQLILQEKGIVSGIMTDEIEAALKDGYAAERIIAKGIPPVPGTDAQFQSLVPEIRERKPRVDERGIAHFRDLGQLIVVKAGEPLMRRIPASEGQKGENIFGQVLMPKSGLDMPFASGLQGAEIDPDDSNSLRATITGQPKLVPNGVIVEPTINLPKVDLSTGNMVFDGTINIKGDITDGMKVCVTGDVFVGGTAEGAEIEAGGNIVIKGGVIGHSEYSADETSVCRPTIVSKGSISARFAENVCMEAGTDIIIEELSMHNHLTALNRILVGKSGGRKGHIIGGITNAAVLVKAGVLGSNSGFITKIKAGFNPYLQAKADQLKLEIDADEKELEDIKKIVAFIVAHPEKNKNDLLSKLVHTREKLETDCAQFHADRMHLLSEMTLAEHVQVIVEEAVHSGVEIHIGDFVWKNNEERGKGVFQVTDGAIEYANTMLSVSGSH